MSVPQWVFVGEYLALFLLRGWYVRGLRAKKKTMQFVDPTERVLMWLTAVGFMILPLIYLLTSRLDFADYAAPDWLGWSGIPVAAATVWLFWRAHADLGTNWSPSLEICDQHELVTHGVYRFVRHPMYASIWLWAISQAMLLPNWIAGLGGLATFVPMYFLRVPREESMMKIAFGEAYAEYADRTGRIVPRLRKRGAA